MGGKHKNIKASQAENDNFSTVFLTGLESILMGVEPFVKDLGKLMFDRCQLE